MIFFKAFIQVIRTGGGLLPRTEHIIDICTGSELHVFGIFSDGKIFSVEKF